LPANFTRRAPAVVADGAPIVRHAYAPIHAGFPGTFDSYQLTLFGAGVI